jgi:hypothetical protein|nr:MAG TPA: hypothetical protein [Caudoviricetes sp.]DAS89699.1 MAG TPA: hypothetical protein [Caudoviricetes sp.]
MKISKLGWLYIALAIASFIIFSCIWRWLDNWFLAVLLIVYPLVYFVAGYFAHYLKVKSVAKKE